MGMNRERAERAISNARREFENAVKSLEEGDYAGSLKYLQESMEYAVKAVLIAYGVDYPKIQAVGRILYELEEKYPPWFLEEIEAIAEVTDNLARGRPRFRDPYEYPLEQYEAAARETFPKAKKALESCQKLKELFS